jgi:hypothetical protein
MENKEFEALNELEEELKWAHNDGVTLTKYDEKRFNVIKQALLELKEIKEAKPSEALERINCEIIEDYPTGNFLVGMTPEEHSAIKQALTTKSKKEQAFDIIKEKQVDVGYFITCGSLEEYNVCCFDESVNKKLTQEEFNLLKEAIFNG